MNASKLRDIEASVDAQYVIDIVVDRGVEANKSNTGHFNTPF